MFNVQVKGNVRCNGIVPPGSGGMAKRGIHNSNAMSPNRGHTISDTKLKFSDRLKAYLSTDGLRSDTSELDDPYTFSDSEVKPLNTSNGGAMPRKCGDSRVKPEKHKVNSANHVDSAVKSELTGKTMSRLQAQIARNKVTVKHNRNSPDLKYDKNHFDKSTKYSIIGLVNNVNIPQKRRLPSGKPMPAHLRARRASAKAQQQHEGSLQRISTSSATSAVSTTISGPAAAPNTQTTAGVSVHRTWHAPEVFGSESREEDSEEESCVYQRHWFNKELELLSTTSSPREVRLELTLSELKRQLLQMKRSRVGHFRSLPSSSTYLTSLTQSLRRLRHRRRAPQRLVSARTCEKEKCGRFALPCTKFCVMHIMDNAEQVLFEHCTAKFADNTQCSVPMFDITHELPLCVEHARKRDNYNRMCLETKPKKPRRKIKPSAMIRPQKRNKKRKKPSQNQKSPELPHTQTIVNSVNAVNDVTELNVCETSSAYESSEDIALGTLSESEFVTIKGEDHIGDQDVVEQVLAMQDEVGGDLELVVEQTLVTQASRLLEETDFTNVLNQIPADEFNDLFAEIDELTVDRNGEYEPSREETEELERALEAVDEDVKSLEKLSQTQGLLDSLLDEHTLVESLVQIPDVFHHNGYEVQCIDSPGAHQASPRQLQAFHPALHVEGLLPVQTQAHAPS